MKVIDQNSLIKEILLEIGIELNSAKQENDEQSEKLLLTTSKELVEIKPEYIDQCLGIIVFGEKCQFEGNILAFFPEELDDNDKKSLKNLINTVLRLRDEKDKERFITTKIYERLLDIEKSSEQHSQNLRKISRSLIPRRFSNFQGIEIAARYQPGNRVGSEYYDAYFKNHQGVLLLITSSSYLLSTIAISLFSELKTHGHKIEDFYKQFINDLTLECENLGSDQDISITFLKINTRSLTLKGLNIGNQLIGNGDEIFHFDESQNFDLKKANVNLKLIPNKPFFICSRGLKRQLNDENNYQVINQITNKYNNSIQDIADEIFLTLKTNENGFLEWDASVLVMEATKNALYSI